MASKIDVVRIDYPKRWFAMGTVVWVITTVALFYLASTTKEDFVRWTWYIAGALVGIFLGLFFAPPLFTHNIAGEKSFRIKMGLLADVTIPYTWIRRIRETSVRWGGVRVGIGVRYAPLTKTLFATTEFADLVALKLDGPHVMGRILKRQVAEVVLSASNMQGFIELISKRAGIEPEA